MDIVRVHCVTTMTECAQNNAMVAGSRCIAESRRQVVSYFFFLCTLKLLCSNQRAGIYVCATLLITRGASVGFGSPDFPGSGGSGQLPLCCSAPTAYCSHGCPMAARRFGHRSVRGRRRPALRPVEVTPGRRLSTSVKARADAAFGAEVGEGSVGVAPSVMFPMMLSGVASAGRGARTGASSLARLVVAGHVEALSGRLVGAQKISSAYASPAARSPRARLFRWAPSSDGVSPHGELRLSPQTLPAPPGCA